MRMSRKKYRTVFRLLNIGLIATVLVLSACNQEKKQKSTGKELTGFQFHKVEIISVFPAEDQTILRVSEKGKVYWIATPKTNITEGELYLYNAIDTQLRTNYRCEAINQQLDSILIVQKLTLDGEKKIAEEKPAMPHNHKGGRVIPSKANVSIQPSNGCITISDVYKQKASLAGKKIKVKGKVVKVNPQIMGHNWVHIQDGTSFSNEFDLTVTTQEQVNVEDVVIFEGTISLEKDFTAGYFYPVIMEDAVTVGQDKQ